MTCCLCRVMMVAMSICRLVMNDDKTMYDYMTSSLDRYQLLRVFARQNRSNMTLAETMVWDYLRSLPSTFRFRRQHIILDYIVDFVCLDKKLVVEIDGAYHSEIQQEEQDAYRTDRLIKLGFSVVRFTNEQVFMDMTNVKATIEKLLYKE